MTSDLEHDALINRIDAVLPQTQCTKCGYNGCRPYATAIAEGAADINQCPPGGDEGIHKLVRLLNRPYKPLNPQNGVEKPLVLAFIDEAICIGCTLCIKACPVDAISGAAKQMHTVVKALCTGCDLCVAPCPVDCISMEPVMDPQEARHRHDEKQAFADASRERFEFRNMRLERDKLEKADRMAARGLARQDVDVDTTQTTPSTPNEATAPVIEDPKKALIAAAMARAKAQREAQAAASAPAQGKQEDKDSTKDSQ
ncbi:MAG: ferredoxin [Rhodocyclales bacterium]|nr:ferredoxin [Rhodocyclales bacterium]